MAEVKITLKDTENGLIAFDIDFGPEDQIDEENLTGSQAVSVKIFEFVKEVLGGEVNNESPSE